MFCCPLPPAALSYKLTNDGQLSQIVLTLSRTTVWLANRATEESFCLFLYDFSVIYIGFSLSFEVDSYIHSVTVGGLAVDR